MRRKSTPERGRNKKTKQKKKTTDHSTRLEESHRHVEGSPSPALEAEGVAEGDGGGRGDVEEVRRADAGGQEGLVGVPPRGVGDEGPLVLADRLGEGRGAVLKTRTHTHTYTPERERKRKRNTETSRSLQNGGRVDAKAAHGKCDVEWIHP